MVTHLSLTSWQRLLVLPDHQVQAWQHQSLTSLTQVSILLDHHQVQLWSLTSWHLHLTWSSPGTAIHGNTDLLPHHTGLYLTWTSPGAGMATPISYQMTPMYLTWSSPNTGMATPVSYLTTPPISYLFITRYRYGNTHLSLQDLRPSPLMNSDCTHGCSSYQADYHHPTNKLWTDDSNSYQHRLWRV